MLRNGWSLSYFTLATIGLVWTWYYNLKYLIAGGGIAPGQFFATAFANDLTTAITVDIYIAALVFSLWVFADSKKTGVKWWWLYVIFCFGLGLAFAFPLFLGVRESVKAQRSG